MLESFTRFDMLEHLLLMHLANHICYEAMYVATGLFSRSETSYDLQELFLLIHIVIDAQQI